MGMSSDPESFETQPETFVGRQSWGLRIVVMVLVMAAIATVWVTNIVLTDSFTERTRNRSELRLALYSGNLLSELRRSAIVPQLLARDPVLIGALNSEDYRQTSSRLLSYVDEIGAAGLTLLDERGNVVGATDRTSLGENLREDPSFANARRSRGTVFSSYKTETGGNVFTYSRRMESQGFGIGVIVVQVDLAQFEERWADIADTVFVADGDGQIILSTDSKWRGLTEEVALNVEPPAAAIERALRSTGTFGVLPVDAYLQGNSLFRLEARIPFQGWRIVSFTTYAPVREQVNGVLALEIMGFALLMAGAFYVLSRRARSASRLFQQESAELRQLNSRLQREIAERVKVQKSLKEAEQTLAQSSKLAVLGEMSAGVSHELNQPLAAMKTYLAGARLLLERKRTDEALSSFQRIDDLINRMGAITRQLKSYARKGGDAFEPFDVRAATSSALSMMEPQLKQSSVEIISTMPPENVRVMGDRLRVEQVIINLFRNALDATKNARNPRIEVLLTAGENATLTVRDNGPGVEQLDDLFEPFYTTKAPGEGTGLGLAISSGIVNDHGGRLTAHNATAGGAVFEMRLPILNDETQEAAE